MKVIAATTNRGKLREIERILAPLGYKVVAPPERLEVEEKGESFLENACKKAQAYYEKFGIPAVADDSGLVVESLEGYPGIYSSRFYAVEYGGRESPEPSPDKANIRKLLRLLEGREDRKAKFVACIVFHSGDYGLFSCGECRGMIAESPRGEGGFGYDPVFIPEGYDRTMAQLSPEEKDSISHRGKALRKLARLLERLSP